MNVIQWFLFPVEISNMQQVEHVATVGGSGF